VNLFLTGYRGCGKTEVGRRLAAMLQREWVDMDAVLAGRLGSSIADHVAGSGWASFRQAERRLLRELCGRDGLVVSTGGGVAADRQNATEMRRSGLVVWLRADPRTIAARIAADAGASGQRPALRSGADPLDEIRTVLETRTPAYAEAADLSIDTDPLSVDEICGRIAAWLATGTGGPASSRRPLSSLDKTKRFK
jgi:shikimate kinase